MKNLFLLTLALFGWSLTTSAQSVVVRDSLLRKLNALPNVANDTNRVLILSAICFSYRFSNSDSALFYGQQAVTLSQKINYSRGEAIALTNNAFVLREIGDLPGSLAGQLKGLQIAEKNNYLAEAGYCLGRIGLIYVDLKDYQKALWYYRQSLKKHSAAKNNHGIAVNEMNIGQAYEEMNRLDSSLHYEQRASEKMIRFKLNGMKPNILRVLGNVETKRGNKRLALTYYQQSIRVGEVVNDLRTNSSTYANIAALYKQMNRIDSCVYYARKGLANSQLMSYRIGILASSSLLAQVYESNDPNKALTYYKIAAAAKDSLYGPAKIRMLQVMIFKEQERQRETEEARTAYQNQVRQYALLAGLSVFLLIAFMLYRTNRQQRKANALLQRQRDEIHEQRTKAETALIELRATQTQLVQKEKMASLGELTAGIAHEIQNPLNFVNNFSEVSAELVAELEEEGQKPDRDTELEAEILGDLRQNLQKITHHGGRASAIVRGMLEHSRTGTGEKQPTNLNTLADEYLKIAFHGLRAKDKNFNAELATDFAPDLGKVNVMPQELGRVLLNLYNNAFYAVQEKQKTTLADYRPTVKVSTRRTETGVEIRVQDNGMGIPDAVKAKIFQPFFTTKPTGEGTGLGLSLSYDIVTKGHGGSLAVESVNGEGTTFVIDLPTSSSVQ